MPTSKGRTQYLWRGGLLPLGREAAPRMGLLRSPTGASSLATGTEFALCWLALGKARPHFPFIREIVSKLDGLPFIHHIDS